MVILSNFFSGSWIPKALGATVIAISGAAGIAAFVFPQYSVPLTIFATTINGLTHFLTPSPIATVQAAQVAADKIIDSANGQDGTSQSSGLFNK